MGWKWEAKLGKHAMIVVGRRPGKQGKWRIVVVPEGKFVVYDGRRKGNTATCAFSRRFNNIPHIFKDDIIELVLQISAKGMQNSQAGP